MDRTAARERKIRNAFKRFRNGQWGKLLAGTAAIVLIGYHLEGNAMMRLLEQAAIFSAVLTMPEASLEAIQERYRDISLPSADEADLSETSSIGISSSHSTVSSSSEITASSTVFVPATEKIPLPSSTSTSQSRYIAPENRGTILSQTFTAIESPIYIRYGEGMIKNSTNLTNAQAEEILDIPCSIPVQDFSEPLVLIYHTHATEAYEPLDAEIYDKTYNWRSNDNEVNMVAVGAVLADKLEQAGIGVVHLTEQHDNPSYNGAYEKSAQSIKQALEEYPSLQVILDIHRDAIQRDADTIVKAVADIDGKKAAQMMIIAGCDDGSLGLPQWQSNFRFSAALQDTLETMYPGLCRPVFFCYRKYNMDLCPNGALIEVGSHGNTLEEAKYAAELLANALAVLLKGQSS